MRRAEEMGSVISFVRALPARGALAAIRFYRRSISPLFPPTCRYIPTCSEYGLTAIQRFGFVKGGWLTLRRICRCHPFRKGGYDPVPKDL